VKTKLATMPLTDREKGLFALAREYIAAGRLPHTVPASVGAGSGSRGVCSLCGLTIEPDHIGYEFLSADGSVTFRFHMPCHAIWQLAASRDSGSRDRAAP
jgi:hypothetical protein